MFYIPVTGGGVPITDTPIIACHFYFSWPSGREVGRRSGFNLQFPDDAEHLSHVRGPSVRLLQRDVYSSPLLIFQLGYFCFYCWVEIVLYVIWVPVPHQTHDLQIFSPILRLPFYLLGGVLGGTKVFHLDEVQVSIFVVVVCAFGVIFKKPVPDWKSQIFTFVCFLWVLRF